MSKAVHDRTVSLPQWFCHVWAFDDAEEKSRDAGVVVGTLAYQRAMNKGMNR